MKKILQFIFFLMLINIVGMASAQSIIYQHQKEYKL